MLSEAKRMRDIVLIITYVFLEIILISPHPARYTRHLLQGEGFKAEKGNIFIEIWGVLVYNILGFA